MLICSILGIIAFVFLIAMISIKVDKRSYLVMIFILVIPFLFNINKLFKSEESFVGINKIVFLIISAVIFLLSIALLSREKSLKLKPMLLLNFGILMYMINRSVLQVGNSLTLLGNDLKVYNRVDFIKTSLLLLIQIESFFILRSKKRVKSAKN